MVDVHYFFEDMSAGWPDFDKAMGEGLNGPLNVYWFGKKELTRFGSKRNWVSFDVNPKSTHVHNRDSRNVQYEFQDEVEEIYRSTMITLAEYIKRTKEFVEMLANLGPDGAWRSSYPPRTQVQRNPYTAAPFIESAVDATLMGPQNPGKFLNFGEYVPEIIVDRGIIRPEEFTGHNRTVIRK